MARTLKRALFTVLCGILLPAAVHAGNEHGGISWQGWKDDQFEQASKEKKLILLNLEAVWCHWCHVMEQETYSKKDIQEIISKNYLAVKVDQDSRPDLANRYRDYGWPATIILSSAGEDIAKRAGFIEPEEMSALLAAAVKDPAAVKAKEGIEESKPPAMAKGGIPQELRDELDSRHYSSFDPELGGLKVSHKFLESDGMELALARFREGSERDREIAFKTMEANLQLVDPVWGGVYQYSTFGRWDRAHFEKIMSTQTSNLRVYALGSQLLNDPRFVEAANKIESYLNTFLRDPSGAYYTSQDADAIKGEKASDYFKLNDAERRKIGIPAIDKHMYSRENGWVISALVWSYSYLGNDKSLENARTAADWVLKSRGAPATGFRHDAVDVGGPYLGDNLAMGQAFLDLYAATGERKWLTSAQQSLDYIEKTFHPEDPAKGGFFTAKTMSGAAQQKLAYIDKAENIALSRFASLMRHYTGKEEYAKISERALAFLSDRSVATQTVTEAGILSADREFREPPLHLVVVGAKSDAAAAALYRAALKVPVAFKRIEWYDRAEGPLPNADVQYPELPKAAAFVCTNRRCSVPLFEADKIDATVQRLTKKKPAA